jgi:ubiquinone/menaquinone biosynthesis C-methylase UbiE
MKLNLFEKVLVNNPVRGAMLGRSVRRLHRMAGEPRLDRVLEIGCGQGDGVRAIARVLAPKAIEAFDLDGAMVDRARRRLAPLERGGVSLRLFVGDAERIDAPDGAFDAVLEFTILHHVPDWRRAQREIARVLRPGGLFLFEELSRELFFQSLVAAPLRRFTVHPYDTMFDEAGFLDGLAAAGLRLHAWERAMPLVGWRFGVASKPQRS